MPDRMISLLDELLSICEITWSLGYPCVNVNSGLRFGLRLRWFIHLCSAVTTHELEAERLLLLTLKCCIHGIQRCYQTAICAGRQHVFVLRWQVLGINRQLLVIRWQPQPIGSIYDNLLVVTHTRRSYDTDWKMGFTVSDASFIKTRA